MTRAARDVSGVICAYTEARWDGLFAAVESVQRQSEPPREIVVAIDHNPALLERVRAHIPGVIVVENREPRGLSGARNSGLAVAQGEVIAFLDEDAVAAPDWLAQLSAGYENPLVLGVGGAIEPMWLGGRPNWFPEEFNWVVGCTYRGMPQTTAPVRNLIGCNMSFRREVFEAIGGFRNGIGRVGTRPLGCEETEFCIRANQHWPQNLLLYQPWAQVYHRVPTSRARWGYFLSRCYAEGLSKALVSQLVGAGDGLASERTYTLRTLPQGVVRGAVDTFLRRDPTGLARAGAIIAGLAFATAGYLMGTVSEWFAVVGQWMREKMSFFKKETSSSGPEAPDFEPALTLEVEIGQPLPDVSAFDVGTSQRYQRAVSLVRLHTQPLGVVELRLDENGLTAKDYARQIWHALGSKITEHLRQDELPQISMLEAVGLPSAGTPTCLRERAMLLTTAPFVSVVVATHDRPESLAACLGSLLSLDYPNYEIIVVDSAPNTSATADLIRQMYGGSAQVRYVREDRPGLAVAHNRGLLEVKAPIVAFTDDDVVVDTHWLTELVRGFNAAEKVACVTGTILPAELQTPAQAWIEQYGGFNKGFTRRIFDLSENRPKSPLYPYAAGTFGSGANMAFKTSFLRDIGGFDPALGAGSAALGGDDLAAFFQVITGGYTLVYEPGAIVHHWHRRDYAGLCKQAYGYGVGLTAYLMKSLLDRPGILLDFAVRIPYGLIYALSPRSPKNMKKLADYPRELTNIERKGMLYGPLAYLRSRWQSRKIKQQLGPLEGPAITSPSLTPLTDEVP